jgi:hypothetical protein
MKADIAEIGQFIKQNSDAATEISQTCAKSGLIGFD